MSAQVLGSVGLLLVVAASLEACESSESEDVPRPTELSSTGPIELPDEQTIGGVERSLRKADGPRFSGIAQWQNRGCTAAYIVPSSLDLTVDGPAYVFTNGHALSGVRDSPNGVTVDSSDEGPFKLRFRYFADSPGASTVVYSNRIVFGTMKGLDLAIAELVPSRMELRAMGIVPFVLSEAPTEDGAEIACVGHPWGEPALLSACRFERRVPMLIEAASHWFDMEANRCAGIATGSSGSPILSLETGKVVAILNTKAEGKSGEDRHCMSNAPCEAGPTQLRFVDGTNYAVPVSALNGCFDGAGAFDASAADCPLDRGIAMMPALEVGQIIAESTPGESQTIEVPLESQGLTHYRYAVGPAASTDCRDVASYGAVMTWADAPSIVATIPGDAGFSLVCILAGPSSDPTDGGWQDPSTPTVVTVQLQ
jgi:hypothetical protein